MYFDTHAHYDSGAFNSDREAVLTAMPEAGVDYIVNPGCDVPSSRTALALAEKFPFIYAAVGFHPEDIEKLEEGSLAEIESLAMHEKCVAIGEIGLDYYWDKEHKPEQKELFIKQIELALRLSLPIIVHDREAHGDCMDIVRGYEDLRGVFHCFSGSAEMAEELLKRGFYLGFDGPITYKNVKKQLEVIEATPLDRILIETDSPYLTPVPHRGKRNDSRMLEFIAAKIGEVKGITAAEAARITKENGLRLFNIGGMK